MNKAIQILRTSNYIIAKLADKTLYVKCIHTGRFSKHSDALKELEQQQCYHEYITSVIALMMCLMSILVGGLYLYGVPLIVSILAATMLLCFVVASCIVIKQCNNELKVDEYEQIPN